MRQEITALIVQAEITCYDDNNQVVSRVLVPGENGQPDRLPWFQRLQAAIPKPVLEWVAEQIEKGA